MTHTKTLLAFKNVTVTKPEFMKELRKHQKADAFLRGTYEDDETENAVGDFRGCAVGCSLHSVARIKGIKLSFDNHELYETHLGIPEWLARLEDRIFENVSKGRAKTWPVEFANAIPIGADLEKVKGPFLIMVLERTLKHFDNKKFPDVTAAINQTIACWKNAESTPADFEKARAAAWAARGAAEAAGAAWAAWAAEAAWAAWAAAREKEFEFLADELIKLLKKC